MSKLCDSSCDLTIDCLDRNVDIREVGDRNYSTYVSKVEELKLLECIPLL